MGFKLAEAFVEFQAKGEEKVIGAMTRINAGLGHITQMVTTYAKIAFGTLVGAAAYASKKAIEAEHSSEALRATLRSLGGTAEDQLGRLKDLAVAISEATLQDDDALLELMSRLLNMGAALSDLPSLTELGVGLGRALFGGDAVAGAEAMFLAQQGNFRQLQRLVPAVKNAKDEQEAYNIVLDIARRGLYQEEEMARSLGGQMKVLWRSVGELAEEFGTVLLPYIEKVTNVLNHLVSGLRAMTPAQKEQIVRWGAIGVAITGVILLGPKLVQMASTVFSALVSLGKAAIFVGQTFLTVLTGPVGPLVAGMLVLALAFAFVEGRGTSLVQRLGNGFASLLDMANVFLGGWQNFCILWGTITSTTGSYIAKGWIQVEGWFSDLWSQLNEIFDVGSSYLGKALAGWWNWISGEWRQNVEFLKSLWDEFWGWMNNKSEQERNDSWQQHIEAMNEIQRETNATQGEIDKYDPLAATAHYSQERDQARKDRESRLSNIDQQLADDLAEKTNQLNNLPRLSDRIKDLVGDIEHGTGLDEFLAQAKAIYDQFSKAPNAPGMEEPTTPQLNLRGEDSENKSEMKFRSLEENFKKNLALALVMPDIRKTEEEEARKQREEMIKQQKRTAEAVETLTHSALPAVMIP